MTPGELLTEEAPIVINAGHETTEIDVRNSGDRPIQVGSHFHFFESNRALEFQRASAYGKRLDIPAGTAVRFEPGESKRVTLIPLGGRRVVRGLNGLTDGPIDDEPRESLERAALGGFRGAP
ncbi:MAG: ureB [Chloroflexi bacterium]|nr:ureB [Chloroflexota bacterium]